jgi:hypothetical protein
MVPSLHSFRDINRKTITEPFSQEACPFALMSFWRQKVSITKNSVKSYLTGSCRSLVYYELEIFAIKNKVQRQYKVKTPKTTLLKIKSNTSSQSNKNQKENGYHTNLTISSFSLLCSNHILFNPFSRTKRIRALTL